MLSIILSLYSEITEIVHGPSVAYLLILTRKKTCRLYFFNVDFTHLTVSPRTLEEEKEGKERQGEKDGRRESFSWEQAEKYGPYSISDLGVQPFQKGTHPNCN